jgi:hypothetical protein
MDRAPAIPATPDRMSAYALPGILCQIAQATTVETAIVIARAVGGQRLYLPREDHLKPGHALVKLVGQDAARTICARWGGERRDIPSARAYLHWYDCRRLRREGKTHAEISRALGLAMNTVAALLKGLARGDRPAGSSGTEEAAGTVPAQNQILTGSNGGCGANSPPGAAEGPSASPIASSAVPAKRGRAVPEGE